MKKLLTALLCLALLAQLTVTVWAEDDLVIEIEQEAPSQDELEDISEDLTVDMDETDASFIEQMDDVSLDESLDIEGDLEKPEDMEILAGDIEDNAGAIESNDDSGDFLIDKDGVLRRYIGSATNVIIPDGVTAIESLAFGGYRDEYSSSYVKSEIESVSIPGSVKDMGGNDGTVVGSPFNEGCCPRLKHVTIRDAMRIPDGAFAKSTIESISLPDNMIGIGNKAFYECKSLKSISIPMSLVFNEIGNFAFEYCENLTTVHLPDIVDSAFIFGECAFGECGAIKNLSLPSGLKTIPVGAFHQCYSLEKMVIPESVEYIGEGAFTDCTSLKEITIPGSVRILGGPANEDNSIAVGGVFERCSSLKRAIIEEGVQQIGNMAFEYCTSLEEVSIPTTIRIIGNRAFTGCKLKGELTVSGDLCYDSLMNCSGENSFLRKLIIREGTKRIGLQALNYYTMDIYIPESVEFIDEQNIVYSCRIHGKTGSYAETFAKKQDLKFIDDSLPTSIALNKTDTVNLTMGKTLTLKATVEPSTAETTLTWKSSDPKIAKVSKKGVVTALKKGEATITVTTHNGLSDSCTIIVEPPKPTSVTITNGDKATLYMGNKLTLKAKLEPKKSESTLTWKSSKPKVAEVSEKGVVTPKKAGTAVITVKTANGKKATITITVKKK